jgi:FixJ family two-component response regulator
VITQPPEAIVSDEATPVVFIVDDDASIREAIAGMLESVGVTVRIFSYATDFLELFRQLKPEALGHPKCLILDIRMPRMGGLELQGRLAKWNMHIPIIFISAYGDVTMTAHAMKAGAHDFLSKPFRSQELLDAVESALSYDRLRWKTDAFQRELHERYSSLTSREQAILRLIARGLMNKQIAWELGLSEITVKVSRAQLMRKMGARSVADLIKMEDKLNISELLPRGTTTA